MLLAPIGALHAQDGSDGDLVVDAVRGEVIRAHLEFLADDALEGRAPGTRGDRIAIQYLIAQFRRLGLEPAGDSSTYVQRLSLDGVETANVLARLPGDGPRADQVIVVGAHYDHFGIGPAVAGDSIYNGAQDNASGTAALLALAEAFVASGVRGDRSIVFAAFGAEEAGLVGSRAFLAEAVIPLDRIVAMLNFDAMNLAGRTRNAAALGMRYSTLGEAFRRAAAAEQLKVPDDIAPAMERFFVRSDQLAFAEAGIPSLFIWFGTDFLGRPPDYARRRFDEYFARRYHQPADEILPWHTMEGAVQQVRVTARLALALADAAERPAWSPESPFPRVGDRPGPATR